MIITLVYIYLDIILIELSLENTKWIKAELMK